MYASQAFSIFTMVNAVIGVGIVALPSAFANIGLPSHGRWSHFQAALFVLYESHA